MNKLFLCLLVLIFFSSSVLALGVSPGRKNIQYTPGVEKTGSFAIVNSGTSETNIVIAVQGELAESVSLKETSFSLNGGETKDVSYVLDVPRGLSPGEHTAEIVILELPKEGTLDETYIGAALAVMTQVNVNVPYPGKHVDGTLNVLARADGSVDFVIPMSSKGDFDIVRAWAEIDIENSFGEVVASVKTGEVSIKSGARREMVATWGADDAQPGNYKATAIVFYDDESFLLEEIFRLGKMALNLKHIEVNDFTLGEIAKFEMTIENKGTGDVEGAFAEMFIYNEHGDLLEEMKSPTHNIGQGESTLMFTYWDTAGARVGTYPAELFLRIGDESQPVQELDIQLMTDKVVIVGFGYIIEKESGINRYLIIAVVILILVNISWFIFFRKKFGGGGSRGKH